MAIIWIPFQSGIKSVALGVNCRRIDSVAVVGLGGSTSFLRSHLCIPRLVRMKLIGSRTDGRMWQRRYTGAVTQTDGHNFRSNSDKEINFHQEQRRERERGNKYLATQRLLYSVPL